MFELFVLLLASYGICFGLMNDKAKFFTDFLKGIPLFVDDDDSTFFYRMFVCPYCTGFHTGWVIFLISEIPVWVEGNFHAPSTVVSALLFAFASSSACYALDVAIERLERQ